jgi:hypothetical protein
VKGTAEFIKAVFSENCHLTSVNSTCLHAAKGERELNVPFPFSIPSASKKALIW